MANLLTAFWVLLGVVAFIVFAGLIINGQD